MDEVDERLVALLRADGRLSIAELGRRVGLSRTATLARVRRLEADQTIRGYHAEVAQGRLGREPADRTHAARAGIVVRAPDLGGYVRRLTAIGEVEEVETVAGSFDLLIRIAAPTANRLDEVLDRINGWRETVRTTTFVVLTRYL